MLAQDQRAAVFSTARCMSLKRQERVFGAETKTRLVLITADTGRVHWGEETYGVCRNAGGPRLVRPATPGTWVKPHGVLSDLTENKITVFAERPEAQGLCGPPHQGPG